MAKNILQDHGDAEGGNTTTTTKKPVKKEKKKTSKDGKGKKSKKEKSKKKSTSSSSDSSSSSDESGGSVEDPEQVMNSLALQLNMSQSMLKIKGSRILKIEDLSPEALQFIMAQPGACAKALPELSTFTLMETGGELYQMRKAAVARLQGKVKSSKRKAMENESVRTQTQAEEACLRVWKKRLLEIYELFGINSQLEIPLHIGRTFGSGNHYCSSFRMESLV